VNLYLVSCLRLDQEAAMILKEKERMAELDKLAVELELRFQAEQEEQERLEEEDRIAVLAAEALLRVDINIISLILTICLITCLFLSPFTVNVILRSMTLFCSTLRISLYFPLILLSNNLKLYIRRKIFPSKFYDGKYFL
jgi:hypothetical protein